MNRRMDSTTSTPNPPWLSSYPSPTVSLESVNERVETPPASLPEMFGVVKPSLVPHGGSADKLGATVTPDGLNFAVYSESASALFVSLYDEADYEVARLEL